MDSIFEVLMMPSPIRDGACQRAMIGPAIGTWLNMSPFDGLAARAA